MMEDHEFCDSCPGCRPAMLDMKTGQPLPDDDPIMVAVNRAWDTQTSFAQRRAYIEVTLKNSRDPETMKLAQEAMQTVVAAARGVVNNG